MGPEYNTYQGGLRMNEISTYQFFLLYQTKNNIKLIDVRESYEYDQYHIDGSQNIPLQLLLDKHHLFVNSLNHYYLICHNGAKSRIAAIFLANQGISATSIVGGISRWPGRLVKTAKYKSY